MNTFHCVNLAGHLCGHQHEALEDALDCAQEVMDQLLDQSGEFDLLDVWRVPIIVDQHGKIAWDDVLAQLQQIAPEAKARWEAMLKNDRYTNEEFIALVG